MDLKTVVWMACNVTKFFSYSTTFDTEDTLDFCSFSFNWWIELKFYFALYCVLICVLYHFKKPMHLLLALLNIFVNYFKFHIFFVSKSSFNCAFYSGKSVFMGKVHWSFNFRLSYWIKKMVHVLYFGHYKKEKDSEIKQRHLSQHNRDVCVCIDK